MYLLSLLSSLVSLLVKKAYLTLFIAADIAVIVLQVSTHPGLDLVAPLRSYSEQLQHGFASTGYDKQSNQVDSLRYRRRHDVIRRRVAYWWNKFDDGE